MPGAHEAGADPAPLAGGRRPPWLAPPEDVNALVPRLWAGHVAKTADGVLTVAGVTVSALAREFGTPLFVVDEDDFRERALAFRRAFSGVDVYYAGKAFLSRAVARWVDEAGLGLDVCTGGELGVAVDVGFPAARIAFHGNNKSGTELQHAVDYGVARVVVDSEMEIARLAAIAADRGVRQPVLVRVTPGVSAHTHHYIATAHEDQKFGFSLPDGSAAAAMAAVHEHRSLELRGLHFHIGSQIFDPAPFEVAVRRALRLYADGLAGGMTLGELDLGGGFGIAYTTRDAPASTEELAAGIAGVVSAACDELGISSPHLSVEPGRSIAGPSTFTLYEVGTTKRVRLGAGGERLYVAVDGGMSDNIRAALYDADFSCTLASRRSAEAPVLARVVGKHCESGDVVVKDEFLPADIRPGDLLAVPGTGAYCRSLASSYNLVPRPGVVAIRAGVARQLVRRETSEDLLRLDVG